MQCLQGNKGSWGGLVIGQFGSKCTGPRGCSGGLPGWSVSVFSFFHGAQGPHKCSSNPRHPSEPAASGGQLSCLLLCPYQPPSAATHSGPTHQPTGRSIAEGSEGGVHHLRPSRPLRPSPAPGAGARVQVKHSTHFKTVNFVEANLLN